MRRREDELAALWAAGAWRGRTLCTLTGSAYTVLYEGRRGGGAGPEFRDAVLAREDGQRVYGDVELHVRASGWQAHGHATDPRHDSVVLHAVLWVTMESARRRWRAGRRRGGGARGGRGAGGGRGTGSERVGEERRTGRPPEPAGMALRSAGEARAAARAAGGS
jgi:Protein of unknown function (DUF2851)